MQRVVDLQHVGKEFGTGARARAILVDVDFSIDEGRHTAIRGRSGSGKSTLLSIIGGLLVATSGRVQCCGVDLTNANEDERARFRIENVGFVFQSFHLLSRLSAWENVAVPLVLSSGIRSGSAEKRAREILNEIGIGDVAEARPAALSGGQQQRVAIARALVTSPRLILADEPTGNLDEESADDVLAALSRARSAHGATLIVVTHDPQVAATADEQVEIVDGHLRARASLA